MLLCLTSFIWRHGFASILIVAYIRVSFLLQAEQCPSHMCTHSAYRTVGCLHLQAIENSAAVNPHHLLCKRCPLFLFEHRDCDFWCPRSPCYRVGSFITPCWVSGPVLGLLCGEGLATLSSLGLCLPAVSLTLGYGSMNSSECEDTCVLLRMCVCEKVFDVIRTFSVSGNRASPHPSCLDARLWLEV